LCFRVALFFFYAASPTEIYPLSLHDALPIYAFFDRRTRGVQGVFDAGLLFLHLDLGRGTDLDHRNAAGQLNHALLQLLAVVVRRDRKSTRLNSSHVKISYAVFCLKKKRQTTR